MSNFYFEIVERRFRSYTKNYEIFTIKNKQNKNISIIAFGEAIINLKISKNIPTVLYLHGNGGHKLECLQIAYSFPN